VPKRVDIYGGRDPRELAFYAPADVARIVRMPPATVHAWAFGMGQMPALIRPASRDRLSFKNVVELHILRVLRGKKLRVPKIRACMKNMREMFDTDHPFADVDARTDNVTIFVEQLNALIDASDGQAVIRPLLERYMERIERDEDGLARRLFPSTYDERTDERLIVVDPLRRFGRSVLEGVNIETSIIAERVRAHESPRSVARDFEIPLRLVNAAIRFEDEMWKRKAA